jgi:AraC-like DNA-binding protein
MRTIPYSILIADPDCGPYYGKVESHLGHCRLTVKADRQSAYSYFLRKDSDLVLFSHPDHALMVDMARFFRAQNPAAPVIALTENGSERLAVTLFRQGVKDYLRKPVEDGELRESLLSALNSPCQPADFLPYGRGRQIDRAIDFIHQYYHGQISLEKAAKEAGMSVSSFCRAFRKETGTTFRKYVNKYRIAKAIDLLRSNGRSMSEIAYDCGFTNQFHFCRIFRSLMNAAPTEYRKSLK